VISGGARLLLALSGLLLAGFLLADIARRGFIWDERGPIAEDAILSPLPDKGGVLILSLTQDGRLRTASGDAFGLGQLTKGRSLASFFPPDADLAGLLAGQAKHGELRLANGKRISWRALEGEPAARFLFVALEEKPDAAAERTAYFASLAHELKTPLSAVLGFAEIMDQRTLGPLPKPYEDYPAIIVESGRELLMRIDAILNLASGEAGAGKLNTEPVNIAATVRYVMKQLKPVADRQSIIMQFDAPDEVWGSADPRAVLQVVQNLISNAIKFSHTGGRIVFSARDEGGDACFSVRDYGIGMLPEDADRATKPFQRGGNVGNRQGTGLGLAVVRSLLVRQNGLLEIDSAPDVGTLVVARWPEAAAPRRVSVTKARHA
jgi:cell cycle sensor histidine kinase DivJ